MVHHYPYSNINENVQILIAHCKTLYLIVSASWGGEGGGRGKEIPVPPCKQDYDNKNTYHN